MDGFSTALGQILVHVNDVGTEAANEGVKEGLKVSAKAWRKGAPRKTGTYAKSIRYRMDKSGESPEGHVYSTMPGLPHLLEKGHAKVGGGRTRAFVHIDPAAKEGFEATSRKVEEVLGRL